MPQIANRVGALVAVAVALALLPGAGAGAAPAAMHDDVASAQLLGSLVNEERVANGLRPLIIHVDLTGVAQAHSRRMAEAHRIWHNDDLFTDSTRSRLGARALGENVAFDGAGALTTHQMLMDSPPHRANILDPRFTDMGVAITVGDDGVSYSTEDFMEAGAAAASVPAPAPAPAPAPPAAPPTIAAVEPTMPTRPAASRTSAVVAPTRAPRADEVAATATAPGSGPPATPAIPIAGAIGLAVLNGLLGLATVRLALARRRP